MAANMAQAHCSRPIPTTPSLLEVVGVSRHNLVDVRRQGKHGDPQDVKLVHRLGNIHLTVGGNQVLNRGAAEECQPDLAELPDRSVQLMSQGHCFPLVLIRFGPIPRVIVGDVVVQVEAGTNGSHLGRLEVACQLARLLEGGLGGPLASLSCQFAHDL